MLIVILFWLSIPVSLVLSIIGVLKDKYWFVLIGAVLFFPISYYFNGSPTFHGLWSLPAGLSSRLCGGGKRRK